MHPKNWLQLLHTLPLRISGRVLTYPLTTLRLRWLSGCQAEILSLAEPLKWNYHACTAQHTQKNEKIYSLQGYLQQCILFWEDRLIKNIKDCDVLPLPRAPHVFSSPVYLLLEAHIRAQG